MYQGFNKENGNIIGTIQKGNDTIDIEDAIESTTIEESLIISDEAGIEYALTGLLNPTNGDIEWNTNNISIDNVYKRTVAMSQMTSMLRDNDRNSVYESAIKHCITSFISTNHRAPVVLDIGCGTGLLSMLCVKHGAQLVIGIEMFIEMYKIAQEVVNMNGFEENILIINAKSTDIEGLPVSPDIIVSELLDSSLLGK